MMPPFEVTSNRSEGRCVPAYLVLICVCEVSPLVVAAIEFVIFKTHSFTNNLGSIYCVSATLLGSGNRTMNKIFL